MAITLPSTRLSLARLQAIKNTIFNLSERMGTSTSPDKVFKNFLEILKSASPHLKLAIAFLTPWTLLIAAISKHAWLTRWLKSLRSYVVGSLYASVTIPSSHPLNRQVLAYMVEHGLGKNARTLALTNPALAKAQQSMIDMIDSGYPYGTGVQYDSRGRRIRSAKTSAGGEDEDKDRQALSYEPQVGTYTFWHKWRLMTFEKKKTMSERLTQLPSGNETIVISCPSLFAGAKPIQDFLHEIKSAPAKDSTTTIYRPEGVNWDTGISRPSRKLNSVTLDSKIKDELVRDIETYLSPATRKYYANRGIPWRRGFLLYGMPGCGKTSFTNALAGHFNLNVYMLSLSSTAIDDTILEGLFEALPARCIVLLEDIDSAGIKREDMRSKPKKKKKERKRRQQLYDEDGEPVYDDEEVVLKAGVTLSGLLNVLDGIHSKEGMVTIMTSNSPDSLDPALVRPGRIDRKVLFGYASKEVIAKLFVHIFEKSPEELTEGEITTKSEHNNVAAMAHDFASRVPADKFTPAEVQGYLLVHRDDSVVAVDGAAEWATITLKRKATGANVERFANDNTLEAEAAVRDLASTVVCRARSNYPMPARIDGSTSDIESLSDLDEPLSDDELNNSRSGDNIHAGIDFSKMKPSKGLSSRGRGTVKASSIGSHPGGTMRTFRAPAVGGTLTPPMSRGGSGESVQRGVAKAMKAMTKRVETADLGDEVGGSDEDVRELTPHGTRVGKVTLRLNRF
ncbi:hypothetical protein LTR37_009498 [Vermiconidia calcicola]|uniref:Uncharacterized protein n=1 Tax=Vermiconidia calcicola TaxID=1690605 RepID=A0ACC3N7R9_9PEZI|nr:hypothetical protein LTR37_009498 [Vermiconidia calcicola]